MKYFFLLLFLISGVCYGQTTYYIQADSVRFRKIGANSDFILENSTRIRTGAYLKNRWNGRTEFGYAVDSGSVSGSDLILWRGNGTQNITLSGLGGTWWTLVGNASTVDGTNFIGTTDNIPFNIRVNNQESGRIDRVNGHTFYGYLAGQATTSSGDRNVAIGDSAMYANVVGDNNVVIGSEALRTSTAISNQVAIGYRALKNSTGGTNTAIGSQAMENNGVNGANVAIGQLALQNNASSNNVAIGTSALGITSATASDNVAIGQLSMSSSTGTGLNTAVGSESMRSNTTGSTNVAIGYQALELNLTGAINVAVGVNALLNNLSDKNTAVGAAAMEANTTGNHNTAVGYDALFQNTTGNYNVALGRNALGGLTIGASNNVGAGHNSGFTVTTGTTNVFLGDAAGFNGSQLATAVNSVALGAGTYTTANNQIILGNGCNVGIGTFSPSVKSILDLTSTTQGFLAPRMTEAQRDAITSIPTGLLIYQTDGTAGFYYYSGSAWTAIGGGGGGDVTKVGTPVNNQIGVWTGDGTIEGDADLTFDATTLKVIGTTFANGDIWATNSDGVGASLRLTASTGGKDWYVISAGSGSGIPAGTIGFYNATDAIYPFHFNNTSFETAVISSTSTTGGGIKMGTSAAGGTAWHLISTGNASSIGGGNLGFYGGTSPAYHGYINSAGEWIVGTTDNGTYKLQVNGPSYLSNGNVIAAGTASANTAPLKLTAGTLNTTAEAGTVEMNASSHYITKASGLRFALEGTIADHYADVNNSGTSETDIYTYTTPASTLAADGEKIFFTYTLNLADITATATIKAYFAGTAIANTGALTVSATGAVIVQGWIVRTAATTARASVTISSPTASTAVYTSQTDLTGLTLSGTNILKITAQAGGGTGGSNDIVGKSGTVSFRGAASN